MSLDKYSTPRSILRKIAMEPPSLSDAIPPMKRVRTSSFADAMNKMATCEGPQSWPTSRWVDGADAPPSAHCGTPTTERASLSTLAHIAAAARAEAAQTTPPLPADGAGRSSNASTPNLQEERSARKTTKGTGKRRGPYLLKDGQENPNGRVTGSREKL